MQEHLFIKNIYYQSQMIKNRIPIFIEELFKKDDLTIFIQNS